MITWSSYSPILSCKFNKLNCLSRAPCAAPLPDNEEPAVLIPLGHPHPEDVPRGTTRKEMAEIVTELD